MTKLRAIKPTFIQDFDLCVAERETGLPLRLAFAALLAVVDREGRFRWKPGELKVSCLPFDDLDFSTVLHGLVNCGLVVKYECAGEVFGCIPALRDYRSINAKELSSGLPAPSEGVPVEHPCVTNGASVDHGSEPIAQARVTVASVPVPSETPEPAMPEPDPVPSAPAADEPVEREFVGGAVSAQREVESSEGSTLEGGGGGRRTLRRTVAGKVRA